MMATVGKCPIEGGQLGKRGPGRGGGGRGRSRLEMTTEPLLRFSHGGVCGRVSNLG